jgi:benzodiazapine receptor
MMKSRSALRFGLCIALCAAIAALGGWATAPQIAGWYAELVKPRWTPPNSVFPIAWTILYGCIAVALYLLWDRTTPTPTRHRAISLFLIQLALNAVWSPVFFGLHAPRAGLVIMCGLLVALVATISIAWRIQQMAAVLLLPYLVWIAYATSLNAGIVVLNPAVG